MKKSDLLKIINQDLLDKLFGFCYTRTSDSNEAEELCSDIVFALVKAAQAEGEIEEVYAFIWRVARNVYEDYLEKKKREITRSYVGDPAEVLLFTEAADSVESVLEEEEDDYQLRRIYQQISFLTKVYREVMIAFYLDGMTVKDIAAIQGIQETTVKQRLFSARNLIRQEIVEEKSARNAGKHQDCRKGPGEIKMEGKPVAFQNIDYEIWGTGNPRTGDPRDVCTRQLSKQVVWLCRNRKRTAKEISEELNLPMLYAEEELEIQTNGTNGSYGLLKRLPDGRYINNFVLLDTKEIEELWQVYTRRIPMICEKTIRYVEEHKEEYLKFPYLNKKVDLNLVLWQHITTMARIFSTLVGNRLQAEYFSNVETNSRPFSCFGYRLKPDTRTWGGGFDQSCGKNICGYTEVMAENIYVTKIKKHFDCGPEAMLNPKLQLAVKAVQGLKISSLSEDEKEHAAKAVAEGYLFREDDMLYTKILVCTKEDWMWLPSLNDGLIREYQPEVEETAKELAALITKYVPEHVLCDFHHANALAMMPVLDTLIDALIEKGLMTAPENGVGAEGCWLALKK
ncbi:MAG: RNA polymerase sigma factor [Lachnospiraceae bacterium]|nr:RNA polymerase sigma factor [Lachnospiraceae bacterium]